MGRTGRVWRTGLVGAMDTFVGYQPLLENVILPQVDHLFAALQDLAAF